MRRVPVVGLAVLVGGIVLAAVTVALVVSTLHEEGDDRATTLITSATAGELLRSAQMAVAQSGGHRIEVAGHNFVLPQWGGIDEGTVDAGGGGQVRAHLYRTGDGWYDVVAVEGETFFRRETCDVWARVPGGGRDVLRPFSLADLEQPGEEQTPSVYRRSTSTVISVQVKLGDGARGSLEVDGDTLRPVRLATERDAASGAQTEWRFSGWGEPADVSKPRAEYDRGPGGNPC